jgi:NDP-sugar pyrophosphorylase family protein
VVGRGSSIGDGAAIGGAVLWPDTRFGGGARIGAALTGRRCHLGDHVEIGDVTLGDDTVVTDYSRLVPDAGIPAQRP